MRNLKDGIRSLVKIDFYGQVHKIYRGSNKEQRCANEVKVLQHLAEKDCQYVPKLIDYSLVECRIVTTNCGSPVKTISNSKAQYLFQRLEHEYGVIHDDPEVRNITYSETLGCFCIIDFELATIIK